MFCGRMGLPVVSVLSVYHSLDGIATPYSHSYPYFFPAYPYIFTKNEYYAENDWILYIAIHAMAAWDLPFWPEWDTLRKIQTNKKAGVRDDDNDNSVVYSKTPARQEVGLWQKERTVKLL